MNQYLISYWLGREIAHVDSLSNYWGAGYEMIVFGDGKFLKLEEYTIVLLTGKFGRGIKLEPAPISTMMVAYQGNVLMIRVFANNIEKLFAIPSILDDRVEVEVIDRDAKHSTLLMTYILENVDNNTEHFPTIALPCNVNEFDKTPIVFKRVGKKLQLHIDRKTNDWILGVVKSNP